MRTETRNVALSNILEFLGITENRYSGIHVMRRECHEAGLAAPSFESRRGEFTVTFYNNIFSSVEDYSKIDKSDMKKAVLEFCEKPRSRAEILAFTEMSRYYTSSAIIKPLVEEGLLVESMPDKPKSSKQRYTKKRE